MTIQINIGKNLYVGEALEAQLDGLFSELAVSGIIEKQKASLNTIVGKLRIH